MTELYISIKTLSLSRQTVRAGFAPRLWPGPALPGDGLVRRALQVGGVRHWAVGVAHTGDVRPDGLQHGAGSEVGAHGGGVAPVTSKEGVSVRVRSPRLACGRHGGRLAHVGEGGVGVCQLFLTRHLLRTSPSIPYLDALEGAERRSSVVTISRVPVPLAPGHEEERQRARVGGSDGLL